MNTNWTTLGAEPSLQDIMADPIMMLLTRSDRIAPRDVLTAVEMARSGLRAANNCLSLKHAASFGFRHRDNFQHPLCRLSRLCEGILPLMGSAIALAILLILISA